MRGYRTQPSETLKKSSCKRFTGESKPRKPMWITPLSIRSAFFLESGCSTKDCMPDLDTWASEAARSYEEALRKALRNELPVPAFRLAQSRKAPMMVSAESLGAWIDKNESAAKALWERGQV